MRHSSRSHCCCHSNCCCLICSSRAWSTIDGSSTEGCVVVTSATFCRFGVDSRGSAGRLSFPASWLTSGAASTSLIDDVFGAGGDSRWMIECLDCWGSGSWPSWPSELTEYSARAFRLVRSSSGAGDSGSGGIPPDFSRYKSDSICELDKDVTSGRVPIFSATWRYS